MKRVTVKRATTMLENDRVKDEVMCTNDKLELMKKVPTEQMESDIQDLLEEFSDVVRKEPGLIDWVQIRINTGDAASVFQRPYNTPVALREAVEKEVDWLVDQGYFKKSHELATPIVTVKKLDWFIRLCVDYTKLIAVTTSAFFYMLTIEEILKKAGQSAVMSTVDLNKGYYQVCMSSEGIAKTAFVCHKGHYEFLRMPFGLKNAPAACQKLTTSVLDPCAEFATPYIDDTVIFSPSWEMHVEHVRKVQLKH